MSYDTSKINEKINKIKENSLKVYDKGRIKVISSSEYLKEDKQGAIVVVDDMTEIEHKVEVGLSSKNLFKDANTRIYIDPTKTYYITSDESTATRFAFYLYDENGNSLSDADDISISNFYWANGTRWYLGSNSSKLNTKLEFKGTGASRIAYLEWQDMKYVNVQFEEGDTPTAYAPYVADFTDCKIYARGKNLLNLEGRTVVNFGTAAPTTKRTFFNEKAIILGLAVNNNYANSSFDFEITKNTISCTASTSSYGLGLDVKIFPNTTYRFSCSERTTNTSVRLIEYDIEGNYIKNTTIVSNSVTTTANTAWGVFMFKADTANYEHYISNPQLEYGSVVTEYEPPMPETEYITSADGTVEGFNPIFPTMTLSTNAEGALVNINYIKDLQKTYNNLIINTALSGGE